jgi:Transposase, Mutator family
VLQAVLEAEMADHLGYDRGETPPAGTANEHNGSSAKTVRTEIGEVRPVSPQAPTRPMDPVKPVSRNALTNFRDRNLAALIAMHGRPDGTAQRDRVGQCGHREAGFHPLVDGVADDPVRVHVFDREQV